MLAPATLEESQLKSAHLLSSDDRARGDAMSHDVHEGLGKSAFETVLKSGTHFTRTTVSNQELTYVLDVIQQPRRARACESGAKSHAIRCHIDPLPVVSLLVYERRDDRQVDITFSYETTFFLYATIKAAPYPKRSNIFTVPLLRGCPVSGGNYLDHPVEAIYFVFPELSVIDEGNYRLCFNLYEMTSNPESRDSRAVKLEIGNLEQHHSANAASPSNKFIWLRRDQLCNVYGFQRQKISRSNGKYRTN